jgi:hypothetical protein
MSESLQFGVLVFVPDVDVLNGDLEVIYDLHDEFGEISIFVVIL